MSESKKKTKEVKSKFVMCCIPLSWQFIPVSFFQSWSKMVLHSLGSYQLGLIMTTCCYMDKMRDDLVKEALRHNPDYLLWLDADQTYPVDTPERLMRHIDAGKMVVGGLTPDKKSGEPLVYELPLGSKGGLVKRTDITVGQGLVKVDAMGFGGIMTSPEVFRIMKPPCFQMTWNRKLKSTIGEDVRFYQNCKHVGIDVWCDTNLFYEHIDTIPTKLKL